MSVSLNWTGTFYGDGYAKTVQQFENVTLPDKWKQCLRQFFISS